jgi:transcription antitermination protein NusB
MSDMSSLHTSNADYSSDEPIQLSVTQPVLPARPIEDNSPAKKSGVAHIDSEVMPVAVPMDQDADDETEDGLPDAGADPRHIRRIKQMQALFAYSFVVEAVDRDDQLAEFPELLELIGQVSEIDQEIQAVAPERPLAEINKVDLAILRLIVFESKQKKTPKKVLINEAVELAKEFGTDSSSRFVNGVLAKLFEI